MRSRKRVYLPHITGSSGLILSFIWAVWGILDPVTRLAHSQHWPHHFHPRREVRSETQPGGKWLEPRHQVRQPEGRGGVRLPGVHQHRQPLPLLQPRHHRAQGLHPRGGRVLRHGWRRHLSGLHHRGRELGILLNRWSRLVHSISEPQTWSGAVSQCWLFRPWSRRSTSTGTTTTR